MNNSSLFPVAPTSGSNVIYVFSAINYIGLIANSLVIIVAVRPHVIPGRAPRLFLVSQMAGEWVCSFFAAFTWIIGQDCPVPDNGLGTFACKLWYNDALNNMAMHTSYTNLVLLAVERFVAVVYPTKHDKFTPALIGFTIFLSWSTGLIRATYRFLQPARQGAHCVIVPQTRESGPSSPLSELSLHPDRSHRWPEREGSLCLEATQEDDHPSQPQLRCSSQHQRASSSHEAAAAAHYICLHHLSGRHPSHLPTSHRQHPHGFQHPRERHERPPLHLRHLHHLGFLHHQSLRLYRLHPLHPDGAPRHLSLPSTRRRRHGATDEKDSFLLNDQLRPAVTARL